MENKNEQNGFELSIFLHNFRMTGRRMLWLPVLLAVLLGGLRYLSLVRSYSPVYEAKAMYIVSSNYIGNMDLTGTGYYQDSNAASQLASTFPYVFTTDAAKQLLKDKTGQTSLPCKVTASSLADSNLLTLTATANRPEVAYNALLTVAELYPQAAAEIIGSVGLTVLEPASKPTQPTNPFQPVRATVRYALIGLVLGVALIGLLAYLRKTVHNTEDLRKLLSIPCLGQLPVVRFKLRSKGSRSVLIRNPLLDEGYLESIRDVCFQLKKETELHPARCILITSTSPTEGKTTISANLALALAEQGHRVILVDADLRKQTMKDLFEITDHTRGLVELIAQGGEVKDALVPIEDTGLQLLCGDSVADDPQSFLSSRRFERILDQLSAMADYVIIDSPPSGLLSDTATICERSDGILYVVRQDYASHNAILDSVQSLAGTGVRFLGSVLNGAIRSTSRTGYGYGKGYGYSKNYGYGYSKYYGKQKKQDTDETM